MVNVLLYCRVSTDEQGEGTSIEQQESFLRAYCNNRSYNIIAPAYREEFSAKSHTLDRPEFKKMYEYCRRHKTEVNKILFLRWDRYARNTEFAFTYKRKIYDELGIEINAIESPIDFGGGDWATLLGLYCGNAQSEDIKISKRTRDGVHGTKLRGKCTHKAPRGYINKRIAKHECWVEVDEPKAKIIEALFREVAKGVESPTVIKQRLYPKLPSSSLFDMLRNPFYAGIIKVPAYNGEPEQMVKGVHEAIVDKVTFDKVQEILDGDKRKTPKLSKASNPDLFLRKYLICPVCGHALTGATSKGNGGHYTYYFCNHDHKHLNARAEDVNQGFVKYVSSLKPNKAVLELYNEILLDIRGENVKANRAKADKLEIEVHKLQERMNRVNDMYFDGEINKVEKEQSIDRYKAEEAKLQNQIDALRLSSDLQVKDKLNYSINLIENLGKFFSTATLDVKIKLLGSIFPEKIEFDGKNYRTKSYNRMLDIIYKETKHLQGKRKSEFPEITENSDKVPQAGVEPARL